MQSRTAARSRDESSAGSTSVFTRSPESAPPAIAVTFLPPSVAGITTVSAVAVQDVTVAVLPDTVYLKYFASVSGSQTA